MEKMEEDFLNEGLKETEVINEKEQMIETRQDHGKLHVCMYVQYFRVICLHASQIIVVQDIVTYGCLFCSIFSHQGITRQEKANWEEGEGWF